MAKKKTGTSDIGPVYSMTGFGSSVRRSKQLDLRVEARSVNHRFLKIMLKIPDIFMSREEEINQIVAAHLSRGAVNIYVFSDTLEAKSQIVFDEQTALRELDNWRNFAKKSRLKEEPSLSLIAGLPNVYREGAVNIDEESAWELLKSAVEEALKGLQASRLKEGQGAARDILNRCEIIGAKVENIRAFAPQVAHSYRQKMLQRVNEILKSAGQNIGDQDLLRETAIFADRCDVSEELSRLDSHLKRFCSKLSEGGKLGKELEFLLQELHREINTIGSKTSEYAISSLVVDIKSELEKMREQAQNVE